jgi:hypothetical protein
MAGVDGYIANLFDCSPTQSGPVRAWIEAHAYLYRKVNNKDILVVTPSTSGLDGTAIATVGKLLPSVAVHQDLIYTALSPLGDKAIQTATKARIDKTLTVLATKLLTAQGFQAGKTTPTAARAAGLPATHIINMWRLHYAHIEVNPVTKEVNPVTKVVTVVLPKELLPRLIKLILSKMTDSSLEKLKNLLKTMVPTSTDCVFISNTVGCTELANYGLAGSIKNYNLSDTAPMWSGECYSITFMFQSCQTVCISLNHREVHSVHSK